MSTTLRKIIQKFFPRPSMPSDTPVIVVMGATACGKSKLAIELAQKFKGEIISADSMQVYRGLDIVSNKVSPEEQRIVKHHMIDILEPEQRYSVVDFRNEALKIIEDLRDRAILPIIVGGTNYYIESLIYRGLILGPTHKSLEKLMAEQSKVEKPTCKGASDTVLDAEENYVNQLPKEKIHTEDDLDDLEKFFSKKIYHNSLKDFAAERLWSILEKVDEKSAHLIHPSDKRKLVRCLQIIQEKKVSYSEILDSVNKSGSGGLTSLGGPLRYPRTCVLWLSCENNVLYKVLDERVDQMIERGLLKELESFHDEYNRQRLERGEAADYTKGIFQMIGFKEFHNYLVLDTDKRDTEAGRIILQECIKSMKLSTKRYSKKQFRWINNRLLKAGTTRDLPPVYELRTSFDVEWVEKVQKPAFEIVSSLIEGKPLEGEANSLKLSPKEKSVINNPGKYHCEACNRTFIGTLHIDAHLKSKSHRLAVEARKKPRLQGESEDSLCPKIVCTAIELTDVQK